VHARTHFRVSQVEKNKIADRRNTINTAPTKQENRVWVALATGRAPSAPSITQMPGTKAPDIAPYEKRGCSLPRHLHDGAQCAAYRNPLPGVGTPSKTVI